MSASLVGSEMCIRDSGAAILPPHKPARGRMQHAIIPLGLGVQGLHGPPPVSYTHLTLPTICSV
eukprot:7105055-Alexandrium_andersonii.AAC.1